MPCGAAWGPHIPCPSAHCDPVASVVAGKQGVVAHIFLAPPVVASILTNLCPSGEDCHLHPPRDKMSNLSRYSVLSPGLIFFPR